MREAETTTSTETQGHSTTFGPTGQQATPGPDQGTSPPVAVAEPVTGSTPLSFRQPRRSDGAALHRLVSECPPLDVNSLYAYLLLCEHFSATCVVAESAGGRIDGFISAYLPPTRPDVIFVWQVAVHSRARGQRLGRAMLRELLQRDELKHVRHLETTVGPDNQASRRMFAGLAGELGAHISEQPFFDRQLFGGADHDDEMLLKIGPFALSPQ